MDPSDYLVFATGYCKVEPGPGGWACLSISPSGRVRELAGGNTLVTAQRMEITAALEALRMAREYLDAPVDLYTDSKYVSVCATVSLPRWNENGWFTATGQQARNQDMWKKVNLILQERTRRGPVIFHLVGSIGVAGITRCRFLALESSHGRAVKLYDGLLKDYPYDLGQLPQTVEVPPLRPYVPTRSARPYPAFVSYVPGRGKGTGILRHATGNLKKDEQAAKLRAGENGKMLKVTTTAEEAAFRREVIGQ